MADHSNQIAPAYDFLEYTSFASPIDVRAASPNGESCSVLVKAVTGDGSLSVVTAAGETRTLTMAAGDTEVVRISSIESATGITRVRVSWPE